MPGEPHSLSRRDFLSRAAALGTLAALAPALPRPASAHALPRGLPDARQIRDDVQRMVDFGPRLTGTPAHNAFIDWLQEEFERAGLICYPRDEKPFTYWNARRWSLELLDGAARGPVTLAGYFPRSGETSEAGVTARLVPAARLDQIAGNIVMVDAKVPLPLTESFLLSMANAYHWRGHLPDPLRDYRRVWVGTVGPGALLSTFKGLGAAGVVFVLDASWEAAEGCYLPFNDGFHDCPAVWVDRDTGAALTRAALSAPSVRLTVAADKRKTTSPSLVAVLPGASDEVMVVNTHTDGQNAFEENGALTLVHLARYFASLDAGKRLRRSLVLSACTGHMTQELPQTQGFVEDHADLVAACAAAMTVEHYGCQEWVDNPLKGYTATGDPEACGLWTSQSGVFAPILESLREHDIPHTYLLRPRPLYLGIGGALYEAGVPGMSFIAGPGHLVNIVPNGHIDKLDAALAERQTRWTASLLHTFDGMTARQMMAGDVALMRPSLGKHKPFPAPRPRTPAPRARCLPATTRLHGRGAGPARLGATPAKLRAADVGPVSTRRNVFRWCVEKAAGRISAVVDRGRVRLVTSTVKADLRRPAKGNLRARRYVAVADRATRRNRRRLARLLRRAGL